MGIITIRAHAVSIHSTPADSMPAVQYQQLLSDEGFPVTAASNMHSHNIPLVKAIVYSASYPNVVMYPCWTVQLFHPYDN